MSTAVEYAITGGETLPSTFAPVQGESKFLDIIDIRSQNGEIDLKENITSLINPKEGPRTLPTLLLYDEKGLQLFEEITYLDEYYVTNKEIELLEKWSTKIASKIPHGSMLIELGSGNLRKIAILLQAFEDAKKKVDYYALDLDRSELERTLNLAPKLEHVSCHGLHGTYDDGIEWLKQSGVSERSKSIVHLGPSLGNMNPTVATSFLMGFANVLGPLDRMIISADSCTDAKRVFHAYNDKQGVTHRFILNGLQHANEIFGKEVFKTKEWKVASQYICDEDGERHQAFLQPVSQTSVFGSTILPHEKIQIEESWKYSATAMEQMWKSAGLTLVTSFDNGDEYELYMLQKQKLAFPSLAAEYAETSLPSLQDWNALWEAWDVVTRGMIPDEELFSKPIRLRHACIFYLGHIPAFLDIQLTKVTDQHPTDPSYFHAIFERGIDPDVDDPSKCHDHSEIPSEWPPLQDILSYQEKVRHRVRGLYQNGQDAIPRHVGRAIWLGFEHEAMHLETLLYMMLQSDSTLPPSHTGRPDFEAMAQTALGSRVANEWFPVPEQTVVMGMEDPETLADGNGYFGWDIEKPTTTARVHKFEAQGRPITNGEYAKYMHHQNVKEIPVSWSEQTPTSIDKTATSENHNSNSNGHVDAPNGNDSSSSVPEAFLRGKSVRTVYGLVPLALALDWPVFASYDELNGCARWMGGRIPTLEEARSIYAFADVQNKLATQNRLDRKVPAVNGHLINDGVEETPPPQPSQEKEGEVLRNDNLSSSFVDLLSENVGFKNWHPTPVTHLGNRLGGQASMGGLWEWTSTPLRKHEGYEPMALYPGYSADFFDEKHNVVLGGSWATHPRIAGRKSFMNWFQRNYPYAWIGARMVRDVK